MTTLSSASLGRSATAAESRARRLFSPRQAELLIASPGLGLVAFAAAIRNCFVNDQDQETTTTCTTASYVDVDDRAESWDGT
jgi:hypothetical protein